MDVFDGGVSWDVDGDGESVTTILATTSARSGWLCPHSRLEGNMCKLLDHLVTKEDCWLVRLATSVASRPRALAIVLGATSVALFVLTWRGY